MKMILTIAGLLVVSALFSEADARISRSCDARMFIVLHGHDGYPPGERTLERFSATATCPNGRPNLCRSRAVDKIFACVNASWNERWQRKTPDECKSNRGINGYSMPNIKCDIFHRICAEIQEMGHPALGGGTATVKAQSSGQTGACAVTNHIVGQYSIDNCTIEERNEHCGN